MNLYTSDHGVVKSCLLITTVLVLLLFPSSCGANSLEKAIVGKWTSEDSDIIFEFFEDRTYRIINPNSLFEKELVGRYHARGDGHSSNLSEAEFVLVNGFDIKFTSTGDAFFLNIDGTRGGDLFYRVWSE